MPLFQVTGTEVNKTLSPVDSCCEESQNLLDAAKDALQKAGEAADRAEEAAGSGGGGSSLVAVPSLTLGEALVVGSSNTFIATAQSHIADVTITKFVLDVPALGISKQEFAATAGSAELSITVPEGTVPDTSVIVSVYAVDSLGNRSVAANKSVTIVAVSLATPNIVSPKAGATVTVGGKAITVMGSTFTVVLGTDEHEVTDWQLMRKGVVISEAIGSSDLTTHTFSNLTLTNGETLTVRCRYKGKKAGYSEWSGEVAFSIIVATITVEGRSIYRHPTEPGSVLQFYDVGTASDVNLLVYDAVKRKASLKWDIRTSNLPDSALPNLTSSNTNGTWYIDGSSTTVTQDTASRLTEAQLNTLWPASIIDPNTAKHNCDVWAGMGISNFPALQYVRSVMSADGKYADIPNIQQLMRIFCMAEAIDALDPTAAANPALKLVGWFNNGYAWASSEYGSDHMRGVGYAGGCSGTNKTASNVAVPVLEIIG